MSQRILQRRFSVGTTKGRGGVASLLMRDLVTRPAMDSPKCLMQAGSRGAMIKMKR